MARRRTKADLEAEIGALKAVIADFRSEASNYGRVWDALPPPAERAGWVGARAEIALTLAAELDGISRTKVSEWKGQPPNVSAIAKELRSCLDALEADLDDTDSAGFFDGVALPSAVGDT